MTFDNFMETAGTIFLFLVLGWYVAISIKGYMFHGDDERPGYTWNVYFFGFLLIYLFFRMIA